MVVLLCIITLWHTHSNFFFYKGAGAERRLTEMLTMLLEQEWSIIENDCIKAACSSAISGGN